MAEIVGPFTERKLAVEGWSVPFVTACEVDGGKVELCVDHRFGIEVDAAVFDDIAWLLAQLAAVALGYRFHPSGDGDADLFHTQFAHLHPALAPRHMVEVTAISGGEDGH